MNITLKDRAIEELNKKIGKASGFLKIQYDMQGCTCSDSGVPTLWYSSSIDDKAEIVFETNDRPVAMEKAHLIYFDENLIIDYSDTSNTFQLKSPQQMINPRMSFL